MRAAEVGRWVEGVCGGGPDGRDVCEGSSTPVLAYLSLSGKGERRSRFRREVLTLSSGTSLPVSTCPSSSPLQGCLPGQKGALLRLGPGSEGRSDVRGSLREVPLRFLLHA